MTDRAPLLQLADSILYVSSLIADQPRDIDRYVDYFGGRASAPIPPGVALTPGGGTAAALRRRLRGKAR
jgi:hypothetical protein